VRRNDGISNNSSGSRLDRRRKRKRSAFRSRLLAAVAGIALIFLAALIGSMVYPSGGKQVSVIPAVKDKESLEKQSGTVREQNGEMQEKVDELSIEVKEIKGIEVKVIEAAKPALNKQDNLQVQGMVMDFVKAQYSGDLKKLKSLSTTGFAKIIDDMPSEFIRGQGGKVTFTSITSVAKEGEDLLVFVRISDTTSGGLEYQENFTIKKVNGRYLVDKMETDA